MKTAKLEEFNKPKKPWEVEGVEWREVRLWEIASHFMGGTPKTSVKEYWGGNIPWISAKELSNCDVYVNKCTKYITERGLKESSTRIAPKNSILLVTTASVGKVAITGRDLAINQQITAITPKENVYYKYLYYYFLFNAINLLLRGKTTFIHINQKIIKKIPVFLPFRNGKPDLETQKKIVEYIETNFEKIDKIIEKKKKELEFLDELWESILEHALKPKEGEEWREVRLEEISHIESGNRPKGGVKKYIRGVPSIGGEHLNYNGTFSFEKLKYVPDEFYKQSNKGKIQKYDILIVKDGATTGKTAFVGENFPFKQAMVNEHVFLCRIINSKIYPEFVFRFLMSKEGQYRILKTKGGTAQGGINKRFSKLVKIPIPFHNNQPDLEKQKEIAQYLDNVYQKIKTLKEKIQNQITQLEEMKESILDEVFRYDEAR